MAYGMSLKDLENWINNNSITTYEKNNGIKNEGSRKILEMDGLKIYEEFKSDGTKTLAIGFCPNYKRDPDTWLLWVPRTEHIKAIKNIPALSHLIDEHNKTIKQIREALKNGNSQEMV